MNLKFKWIDTTAQFSNGSYLYLGNIRIAMIECNSFKMYGCHNNDLFGEIYLPSTPSRVYSDTKDGCKKKVEDLVTIWFDTALKESLNV